MISMPPACLVRSLSDMQVAIAPGLAVTFLSAPGAALHAGPLLWRALVASAVRETGAAPVHDVLDCIDASGRALEALRLGQSCLVLDPGSVGYADVFSRAASVGAQVLPSRPPALDVRRLTGARDGRALLLAWLRGETG